MNLKKSQSLKASMTEGQAAAHKSAGSNQLMISRTKSGATLKTGKNALSDSGKENDQNLTANNDQSLAVPQEFGSA